MHKKLTEGPTGQYIPKLIETILDERSGRTIIMMEYMNGGTTGDNLMKFRKGILFSNLEVVIIASKLVKALIAFKEMGIAH